MSIHLEASRAVVRPANTCMETRLKVFVSQLHINFFSSHVSVEGFFALVLSACYESFVNASILSKFHVCRGIFSNKLIASQLHIISVSVKKRFAKKRVDCIWRNL